MSGKIFVSVRKTEGSYYKKTSLLSIRAALDRHLKAPKSFKNMSLLYFLFSNNHQCNYIPKQLVASRDVNIGEVRLGDYSPVFTSQ